jgi:methionine-rich copper-binding protein CopC
MPLHRRRLALFAALGTVFAALSSPIAAMAHAELVSSDPQNGATVPAGFTGPIVLTYDEALAEGSHAELMAPDGSRAADAAIDQQAPERLVFALASPLAPGAWTIQWTSVAADRDVERGQVAFTVAAATPSPTAPPTVAPTASPTPPATASAEPSATPPPSAPAPSPTPGPTSTSATDALIPIVAALAVVALAGVLLLRRR